MALTTITTAALIAIPVRAWRRPATQDVIAKPLEVAPPPEAPSEPPAKETINGDDHSAPGGGVVVLTLFGLAGVLGLFVCAFVFPPAFVAAGLTFGSVSILGLVVLYVHFRVHARSHQDSS